MVKAGPITVDGQAAILMERLDAIGSKEIVKTIKGDVITVGTSPYLNEKSIADLTAIRKTLVEDKIWVNDLQFLIKTDGSVVIADPAGAILKKAPSTQNKDTINALINVANKNLGR